MGNETVSEESSNSWDRDYGVSALIGIIGGTGIYGVDGMVNKREVEIDTPFGKPSSKVIVGEVEGTTVAFIARHDTCHRLLPTEIPFRANIFAFKLIGVQYLLSFGTCGSLKENVAPMDIVMVDQFLDRTTHRQQTFFGDGIIAHVAMGDPVCHSFKDLLYNTLKSDPSLSDTTVHSSGTYICIEGPSFSTKAESAMYRLLGGTVIGMTAVPECKLAREAEMAYALVALVTDYDCWHPDHDNVTVELVMNNLKKNSMNAQKVVKEVAKVLKNTTLASKSHNALQNSILTHHDKIPRETAAKLRPILHKYVKNH